MASQYYTPLSNGLQSFADASPEYEFADVGIGSFREQAGRLAEFGRNGDIYVVHALPRARRSYRQRCWTPIRRSGSCCLSRCGAWGLIPRNTL